MKHNILGGMNMKLTKTLLMITLTTTLANCGAYGIPGSVGSGQVVVTDQSAARNSAGANCGQPGFQSLEIRCTPQPQDPVQGGTVN